MLMKSGNWVRPMGQPDKDGLVEVRRVNKDKELLVHVRALLTAEDFFEKYGDGT